MVNIKGIQKTSLIDYLPYVVSTVFLGKCNFRCPYCHNPDLVLNHLKLKGVEEDEFLKELASRGKWIDGVCITGGEPTISEDLYSFIEKIKKLNFRVKLDTNGTNPLIISELIKNELVDYIAMDIKGPLDRYEEIVRRKVDISDIKKSVKLIMDSSIDYEFRTTFVPALLGKEDVILIGRWLSGASKYVIQQFRNNKPTVDKSFSEKNAYTPAELNEFKEVVDGFFESVEVRE